MRRSAQAVGVELSERYGHITIPVERIGAEDSGARLEGGLRQVPGVLTASVNMAAQAATIEFDCEATGPETIRLALDELGRPHLATSARCATRRRRPSRGTSATGNSSGVRRPAPCWSSHGAGGCWLGLAPGLAIAPFVASYAFGGFDLVRHWVASLRAGRASFDIDLLMLLAAVGAAVLGAWAEGAFLLFLFSFAHALEHYALGRARNAIKALGTLAPRRALILRAGATVDTAIQECPAR